MGEGAGSIPAESTALASAANSRRGTRHAEHRSFELTSFETVATRLEDVVRMEFQAHNFCTCPGIPYTSSAVPAAFRR